MLVFIKEDYFLERLWSKWSGGKWRTELNVGVTAILFKPGEHAALGVFCVLYFWRVAVIGPCLLELKILEISFCNVYGVVYAVSILVLYCLVVFWTNWTSFFFFSFKWIAHSSTKEVCFLFFFLFSFFMIVAAVLVISEMAHLRMSWWSLVSNLVYPKDDEIKKEKMDQIFKDKCCIAISLWLQDQQIWWHPQECPKSIRNIGFMHLRSCKEDKNTCLGVW